MRFRTRAASVASALVLLAAAPYALTVDQEFDGPFAFDMGVNATGGVSQSFTPAASRLDAVDIFFTGSGSNPPLALPVNIRTSLNGPIIGSSIAAIPAGITGTPSSPTVIQVTFTPFIPLTPGAQYFIQVDPDGGFLGVAASFANGYPAGDGYQGDFTIADALDWGFRTYAGESGVGPPANKDQCKNGGWAAFTIPRAFKNQGDCIQFVNTGK